MARIMLTDEHWSKLKVIMLQVGIYDKRELRRTTEGILFRLRTGIPWRDLPTEFGYWNTVYKRFNEWSQKGKLLKMFKKLATDPDDEWSFVDGSIVQNFEVFYF